MMWTDTMAAGIPS